jgi:hypothetical protein
MMFEFLFHIATTTIKLFHVNEDGDDVMMDVAMAILVPVSRNYSAKSGGRGAGQSVGECLPMCWIGVVEAG